MFRTSVGALLAVTVLSGCLTSPNMSREDKLASGAALGALAGGVLAYNLSGSTGGTRFLMAALGAGAGAVGGYWGADRLTRWDKTAMNDTLFSGLEDESNTGNTLTWANDDSGNSGSFTPTRTFLDHKGRICREFEMTLEVDAEQRKGNQTACRTATGNWILL